MSGAGPVATPGIHPTAIVDGGAELAPDVVVGPGAIIGPGVTLGAGVVVGANAQIERDTSIGPGTRIWPGAILGGDPQDLKYAGEASRLVVGARTRIREFCTLNRGTGEGGVTRVGDDCLLMAYAHVAHDCSVGDGSIMANAANLGGHVEVGPGATIGGLVGVHQFVRIGTQAFVGACSKLTQDVPPFLLVDGHPGTARGVNSVGLLRRGYPEATVRDLRRAYRMLYKSKDKLRDALAAMERELPPSEELSTFIDFVRSSERGIVG